MTSPPATPVAAYEHRVTFPDLVRVHYRWRKAVGDGSTASEAEREAVAVEYRAPLAKCEAEHGEIVSAYWCADFESAVVLTAGRPHTGWLRRLLAGAPAVQRVWRWA